jgi:hypothetical protein
VTPAQIELRLERLAIMRTEGATDAEIAAVFKSYPEWYGVEETNEEQGVLI